MLLRVLVQLVHVLDSIIREVRVAVGSPAAALAATLEVGFLFGKSAQLIICDPTLNYYYKELTADNIVQPCLSVIGMITALKALHVASI